jgi:hypothetical protein
VSCYHPNISLTLVEQRRCVQHWPCVVSCTPFSAAVAAAIAAAAFNQALHSATLQLHEPKQLKQLLPLQHSAAHLLSIHICELCFAALHICQAHCLAAPESLFLVAVAEQVLQLSAHECCSLAWLYVQELCMSHSTQHTAQTYHLALLVQSGLVGGAISYHYYT